MIKNTDSVFTTGLTAEDTRDNGKSLIDFRENGKQHGQGKYYLLDNTIKTGIWEDGKRIKWLEENSK
jgi:hypothetical protein